MEIYSFRLFSMFKETHSLRFIITFYEKHSTATKTVFFLHSGWLTGRLSNDLLTATVLAFYTPRLEHLNRYTTTSTVLYQES